MKPIDALIVLNGSEETPSAHRPPQLDQIRSSLGHLRHLDVTHMDTEAVARLLRPPVNARWQYIGMICVDARTGNVLTSMPTLTSLFLLLIEDVPHLDFLSKLPRLAGLTVVSSFIVSVAALVPRALLPPFSPRCEFSAILRLFVSGAILPTSFVLMTHSTHFTLNIVVTTGGTDLKDILFD